MIETILLSIWTYCTIVAWAACIKYNGLLSVLDNKLKASWVLLYNCTFISPATVVLLALEGIR